MTRQHQLDRDLHSMGAMLDLPAGDLDAVVARGRSQQARGRVLLAVSAAAAVALLAGGVAAVVGTDDRTPVSFANGSQQLGEIGIDWQVIGADRASSLGSRFSDSVTGSGPLYAVSTGGGETEDDHSTRVLWTSVDGNAWAQVTTLGNDLFLADLQQVGARLYAVGTGAAEHVAGYDGPISDPVAGWSDDGGETWQQAGLPFDITSFAEHSSYVDVSSQEVFASPVGTVVVLRPFAAPDIAELLPSGVTLTHGWARSQDGTGIDVLGAASDECGEGSQDAPPPADAEQSAVPCEPSVGIEPASSGSPNPFSGSSNPFSGSLTSKVVSPQDNQGVTQHLTWQELGISGDFLTAVRHESVAFLAPPGSTTFGRLAMEDITSSSSPGRQATITDVIGVPDGVVASVMVEAGVPRTVQTEYFHSSDGLAWQPWAAPAGMYVLDAVGTFEGQLYVAGAGMLARMEPGGSWTPIDIAGLVGEADQPDRVMVSVGPNGIAAVVEIVDAESGDGISRTAILSSRDGVTWQAWDLGDLIDRQLMTGDLRVGYVGDQIVINVQAMPAGRSSYDDAMELEPMTLVGTPT